MSSSYVGRPHCKSLTGKTPHAGTNSQKSVAPVGSHLGERRSPQCTHTGGRPRTAPRCTQISGEMVVRRAMLANHWIICVRRRWACTATKLLCRTGRGRNQTLKGSHSGGYPAMLNLHRKYLHKKKTCSTNAKPFHLRFYLPRGARGHHFARTRFNNKRRTGTPEVCQGGAYGQQLTRRGHC